MKHVSQRQKGMTVLGVFLMIGIFACLVLFGLRLFPLYNEYLGIKSVMESVMNQPPSARSNVRDIRKLFLRNANLNSLYAFNDNNVKDHVNIKKSKDGKKKYFHVHYENKNILFKNIYLYVVTNEAIELTSGDKQ